MSNYTPNSEMLKLLKDIQEVYSCSEEICDCFECHDNLEDECACLCHKIRKTIERLEKLNEPKR